MVVVVEAAVVVATAGATAVDTAEGMVAAAAAAVAVVVERGSGPTFARSTGQKSCQNSQSSTRIFTSSTKTRGRGQRKRLQSGARSTALP
jgi:hypothetical protein